MCSNFFGNLELCIRKNELNINNVLGIERIEGKCVICEKRASRNTCMLKC
jgi:hypothetical protein